MSQTTARLWSKIERDAWRLPEDLTVSQWADKNRVLDSRNSAEPGPWRTSRTPYLQGVMDAFCDAEVEIITLQKSPQSGGTEAILNMIGYAIDQDPSPSLLVMPREEDCAYASINRLKPMIGQSPQLQGHTTGRIWDLSKMEFYFDRMTLYFAGSNSPAGLAAKPVKFLFLDEVNKFPPFAGKEANPIDLAVKRTITFWDRKIVEVSTPTTTDGYITLSYNRSNKQQYYIPCPHCGRYSVWRFEQLKIDKKLRDPDQIRKSKGTVWYECEFCKKQIEEIQKDELVAKGEWLAEGQKIDAKGKITGEAKKDRRHSGFHFSALISPWVSWTEIMAQWFEANTEEGIAIGKLLDFMNSILAEPWQERGRAVKANELEKRRGDFSRGTVPDDCLVLVAGADYHEDQFGNKRIDYEVRGFGYTLANWAISSGRADSWEQLEDEVLFSPFPWANPRGPNKDKPELAVIQLFVDARFLPDEVCGFCIRHPGIAMPAMGASHKQRTPLVISNWEKASQGRAKRYRGLQLMIIDTEFFKNQVTGWAEKEAGEAGSTEYYAEIPDVYFTEFCNEQKIKTRDKWGREHWVWRPVKKGAPTHFLDTAVNAAAAAFYRRIQYLRRPAEQQRTAAAARPRASGQKKRPKKRVHQGFLDDLPRLTFR